MWKCAKCKREFAKNNQNHSCVNYPINNHFEGKDNTAEQLFNKVRQTIDSSIGPVKIESLPCCIHFVSDYTFGALWAMKDRVKIDFRVDYDIVSDRFYKKEKLSSNRFLYYMEIKNEKEIDDELIGWLRDSYNLNR